MITLRERQVCGPSNSQISNDNEFAGRAGSPGVFDSLPHAGYAIARFGIVVAPEVATVVLAARHSRGAFATFVAVSDMLRRAGPGRKRSQA